MPSNATLECMLLVFLPTRCINACVTGAFLMGLGQERPSLVARCVAEKMWTTIPLLPLLATPAGIWGSGML